jgi:hypothetical protein
MLFVTTLHCWMFVIRSFLVVHMLHSISMISIHYSIFFICSSLHWSLSCVLCVNLTNRLRCFGILCVLIVVFTWLIFSAPVAMHGHSPIKVQ